MSMVKATRKEHKMAQVQETKWLAPLRDFVQAFIWTRAFCRMTFRRYWNAISVWIKFIQYLGKFVCLLTVSQNIPRLCARPDIHGNNSMACISLVCRNTNSPSGLLVDSKFPCCSGMLLFRLFYFLWANISIFCSGFLLHCSGCVLAHKHFLPRTLLQRKKRLNLQYVFFSSHFCIWESCFL
jgi:hypothetical protein